MNVELKKQPGRFMMVSTRRFGGLKATPVVPSKLFYCQEIGKYSCINK